MNMSTTWKEVHVVKLPQSPNRIRTTNSRRTSAPLVYWTTLKSTRLFLTSNTNSTKASRHTINSWELSNTLQEGWTPAASREPFSWTWQKSLKSSGQGAVSQTSPASVPTPSRETHRVFSERPFFQNQTQRTPLSTMQKRCRGPPGIRPQSAVIQHVRQRHRLCRRHAYSSARRWRSLAYSLTVINGRLQRLWMIVI